MCLPNVVQTFSIQHIGSLKGFPEDIFWIEVENKWRKDAVLFNASKNVDFIDLLFHTELNSSWLIPVEVPDDS